MNAKKKYQEEPQKEDEYNRLLCTVPGCGKIWTVKIDKPMCSFHQWKKEPKKSVADVLKPKEPQWYDKDEF
jgi:hypothetical protein